MKPPSQISSVDHDLDRHPDIDRMLPEGWSSARLGAIADSLTYGYTASATAGSHGPRFLRITDIQNGKVDWNSVPTCTIEERDIRKYGLVPGDIVFARTGATTGKSFLIKSCPLAVFASYLIRLRLLPGINPVVLEYFFQTPEYWAFISDNVAGIAQPNCNATKLSELQVPMPPSGEQKRLVEAIETALPKVNAARDHLSRVPAILKRFRQAVLAAACSGRLTEEWRESHPDTESASSLLEKILAERMARFKGKPKAVPRSRHPDSIDVAQRQVDTGFSPDVPDTWIVVTWDDLTDWITYGFTRPMPHLHGGIPIVTAKNVLDGRVDFSSANFTSKTAFAELSDKDRPHRGEILLTKDGSMGRAAIVDTDEPFCINQSVAVLRFGGLTAHVPYLLRVIQSPFTQDLIREGAGGTAIPHISITTFGTFAVPLPPLEEQIEIVRRVDGLFRLIEEIEERLAMAGVRADKLTQSILAKAFRGELVPTEAELARREGREYEPASVLLERIKAERASLDAGKTRQANRTTPRSAKSRAISV